MGFKRSLHRLLIMTKAERNGVVVLLFLVVMMVIVRIILPGIFKDNKNYLLEIDQKITILEREKQLLLDSIENTVSHNYSDDKAGIKTEHISKSDTPVEYFSFDPNLVSFNELIELGVDNRIAQTILNYRTKGGRFYKSEDLLKIYGLDSSLYKKLEAYITITPPKEQYYKSTEEKLKVLEINTADTVDFKTLPGIGSVYAKRICNFRKALGGFIQVDQLMEVYGITRENYELIESQLSVDSSRIERININFADVRELQLHPYCSRQMATDIVQYRSVKGSFEALDCLVKDSVLEPKAFQKLKPYLTVR